MARRLIATYSEDYPGETRTAKVYRDSEWNEYRVVFYVNGSKQMGADYHDDDKLSALSTADSWTTAPQRAIEWARDEITAGGEWPDVQWQASQKFSVSADTLQSMYDNKGDLTKGKT